MHATTVDHMNMAIYDYRMHIHSIFTCGSRFVSVMLGTVEVR